MQKGRTKKLLAQAALAGGIASGSTTLMMYPLDTLKTRVQSAAGASVASIVRSAPSIGLRGLYRCRLVTHRLHSHHHHILAKVLQFNATQSSSTRSIAVKSSALCFFNLASSPFHCTGGISVGQLLAST